MFAYLQHHFPLGRILHPFASRVFAIYDPWIVLAAIYTVHSEKQETFWLHWTYSVCTIPWEEVFPPVSQADDDHKQGHTTEIPLKQDARAKAHFSLLGVVITKSYVECFHFDKFFFLTNWLESSLFGSPVPMVLMCRVNFSWYNGAAQWTWPCTQPWFNPATTFLVSLTNLVLFSHTLQWLFSLSNCQTLKTMLAKTHFGCLTVDTQISWNGM